MISILSLIVLYMLRIHIDYQNQLKDVHSPVLYSEYDEETVGKWTIIFVWKRSSMNIDHRYFAYY